MKYKAIIETDNYKDFEFFEDGNGKYIHGIDANAANNEWIPVYFTECEQESVLDKIKSEITDCLKALDNIEKSGLNIYLPNEMSGRRLTYQQCLKFIDKYKMETE